MQRQVGERQAKDCYEAQRERYSCFAALQSRACYPLCTAHTNPGPNCSKFGGQAVFLQICSFAEKPDCFSGTGQHWLSIMMTWCVARSRLLMLQSATLKGRCLPSSRPGRAITPALSGTWKGQIASCWTALLGETVAFQRQQCFTCYNVCGAGQISLVEKDCTLDVLGLMRIHGTLTVCI